MLRFLAILPSAPNLLAAALLLAPIYGVDSSFAATRDVCPTCQYQSINSALEGASDGTTIRVASGIFDGGYVPSNANGRINVIGGWKSDFSEQNPSLYPTSIPGFTVGYYAHADVSINGFEISGSSSQGVVVWSINSSISVENCDIHDNQSSGIYVLSAKNIKIKNNTLRNNNLGPMGISGYAGIEITDSDHQALEVSGNSSSLNSCTYCFGITIYNAKSQDFIAHNVTFNNAAGGLNVRAYLPTSAHNVEWNVAYHNSEHGILLQGGSPSVRHNLSYENGGMGMLHSSPNASKIYNNVLTRNAREGLSLIASSSTASQEVVANIFEGNDIGFNIAANNYGWGSTSLLPITRNNIFFNNTRSEVVHSGRYPWGFESPHHSDYGCFNDIPGFSDNIVVDPSFQNSNSDDFSLKSTSFAIDEGPATLDASDEPSPNGNRTNIGLHGGSELAELSVAAPELSALESHFEGRDLVVSFDTSTSTEYYWLDLSYLNNGSPTAVPPTQLSGAGLSAQYSRALIRAGEDREIRWINALDYLPNGISSLPLSVTLSHGNDSTSLDAIANQTCDSSAALSRSNFSEAGGFAQLTFTSSCNLPISSSANWVTVQQSSAGPGEALIELSIAMNHSSSPRSAVLHVGDRDLAISQSGTECLNCGYTNAPEPTPTASPTPPPVATASPTPIAELTLQVLVSPSAYGKIRVSPAQSCGSNCFQVSANSKKINISAIPKRGYALKGLSSSVTLPSSCKSGACSANVAYLLGKASAQQSGGARTINLLATYTTKTRK